MTAQQLAQHLRHLAELNLLIVQSRKRIERQRLLLGMLDADGHKARKAQDTMARFVKTLQGIASGSRFDLGGLKPRRWRPRRTGGFARTCEGSAHHWR